MCPMCLGGKKTEYGFYGFLKPPVQQGRSIIMDGIGNFSCFGKPKFYLEIGGHYIPVLSEKVSQINNNQYPPKITE